jgi:hypothetical protein
MPDQQPRIIAVMQDAVDASARARKAMAGVEETLVAGIGALESGADVIETLVTSRVRAHREELTAALQEVERTRHQFRLVLVAECQASGMSVREIAELWGFSRQRAAQLIQETTHLTGG